VQDVVYYRAARRTKSGALRPKAAMILDQEQAMTTPPVYSQLFSCLYDQPEPIGSLGRGAHYSVFRSVQWRDIDGDFRDSGRAHDFAVVWDEDHDTRIITVIEHLHMAGLLWPIVFIGERKGALTILFAYMAVPALEDEKLEYHQRVIDIAESNAGDNWICEFGWFHRNEVLEEANNTTPSAIIADSPERVVPYLAAIDVLWQLGEKRRSDSGIARVQLRPAAAAKLQAL
jgi:hypothetical protein